MKKTIRLTLLAVAAAALLTSCDAMLETLFPKDTVGTGTGSNTLTINVTGYQSYGGYWGYYGLGMTYGARPLYVQVYDQGSTLVATSPAFYFTGTVGYSYNSVSASTQIVGLKDGTYTFKIWYDYAYSGTPDWTYTNSNGWYYTDYVYTSSGYTSSLYLPNNGQTNVSVDAYIYEEQF